MAQSAYNCPYLGGYSVHQISPSDTPYPPKNGGFGGFCGRTFFLVWSPPVGVRLGHRAVILSENTLFSLSKNIKLTDFTGKHQIPLKQEKTVKCSKSGVRELVYTGFHIPTPPSRQTAPFLGRSRSILFLVWLPPVGVSIQLRIAISGKKGLDFPSNSAFIGRLGHMTRSMYKCPYLACFWRVYPPRFFATF